MKKKDYLKPEQRVVVLRHRTPLLQSSVKALSTNIDDDNNGIDDFIWGGGGNGNAR